MLTNMKKLNEQRKREVSGENTAAWEWVLKSCPFGRTFEHWRKKGTAYTLAWQRKLFNIFWISTFTLLTVLNLVQRCASHVARYSKRISSTAAGVRHVSHTCNKSRDHERSTVYSAHGCSLHDTLASDVESPSALPRCPDSEVFHNMSVF
jgi:hypothetical protein